MQEADCIELLGQRLIFRAGDQRVVDLIVEFLVADLMFAVAGLCDIWTQKESVFKIAIGKETLSQEWLYIGHVEVL